MCLVDYELVQLEKQNKKSTLFQPLQSNTLSQVNHDEMNKKYKRKHNSCTLMNRLELDLSPILDQYILLILVFHFIVN